MANKPGIVSTARGLIYIGIPSAQVYDTYNDLLAAGVDSSTALKDAIGAQIGIVPLGGNKGKFDMGTLMDKNKALVVWTVADVVASKVGIWKRVGRLLRGIGL